MVNKLVRAAVCTAVLVTPAAAQPARPTGCDADNAGLTLPAGFCAGVFARGVPAPRHIAVAANGDVFVISNRGRGGGGSGPARGVFRLRDANSDGKADSVERVADGVGTGIVIAHGALYTEAGGTVIVRHHFRNGSSDFSGVVDTIVWGLTPGGGHFQRNFVVRGTDLFVNVGSASNACQSGGRRGAPPTPAPDPCPELDVRAGIWRFGAVQKTQQFSSANRFATGFRNGVGLTMNPADNQVYAMQHGRDQLGQALNKSAEYNAENPGEELHLIIEGADYGWPYCFYSHEEKKKVLAPEYGGDGVKVERCASTRAPVYAFPGHWAPNASFFYTGTQFPAEYRDGIFVAFHGSWNRAPLPQAGFNVTFLPMKNAQPAGAHRVFADGFYGDRSRPANTPGDHRPSGLAQSRDGALLVSDDVGGMIYRIVYRGN